MIKIPPVTLGKNIARLTIAKQSLSQAPSPGKCMSTQTEKQKGGT